MISFKEFMLLEGNPLAKLTRKISKGTRFGTISPERGNMNREERKSAHDMMKSDLQSLSDAGMISFTGPHKGLYMYKSPQDGESAGISKEGSYLLMPGKHPKAKQNFLQHLKTLGAKHGQESVVHARSLGNNQESTGELIYTTGKRTGEVDPMGSMRINLPLKQDTGETTFKNKQASFTFR